MAITRFSNSNFTTGNKKFASFDTGYPSLMAAPTATDGGTGTTASIAFPAQTGATSYTAISTPGSFTGTGASSPITVSGLSSGTAYTFQIRATNSVGAGPYSAASNSITPAVPPAMEPIQTITLSSNQSSVTFSSIPQTYKHLQVRIQSQNSYGGSDFWGLNLAFNGNTGNAHGYIGTNGTSSVFSSKSAGTSRAGISTSGMGNIIFCSNIIDIYDYTSTTKWKNYISTTGFDNNNTTNGYTAIYGGYYASTSAVSSLIFTDASGYNLYTNSTFALYGIKGS